MNDPTSNEDTQVQLPQRVPPRQVGLSHHSSVRDSTQPRRHMSNTQRFQERALPSPPISRLNSNQDDENNRGNGTQVQSAVRRGDEHVSNPNMPSAILKVIQANTDYDVLARHHFSNRYRKSPDPDYLSSVRDGTRPANNRRSKHRQVDAADPQRVHEIPTAERVRVAAIPQVDQAPVVQRNGVAATISRAQDDDAFEIPAARREGVPVAERNHAANGGHATAPAEDGGDLQSDSGDLPQVQARRGRYSKNPKGTVEAKAWQIGYYPPLWTKLLETAKAEMRRSLFRHHPFLANKKSAVDGECYEVLLSIITRYEKEQMFVERGM